MAAMTPEGAAVDFITEGSVLTMYLQSGKRKHDRFFWLEGGLAKQALGPSLTRALPAPNSNSLSLARAGKNISWDKKKAKLGKSANKSEIITGAEPAPAIKSAKEWFEMIGAGSLS